MVNTGRVRDISPKTLPAMAGCPTFVHVVSKQGFHRRRKDGKSNSLVVSAFTHYFTAVSARFILRTIELMRGKKSSGQRPATQLHAGKHLQQEKYFRLHVHAHFPPFAGSSWISPDFFVATDVGHGYLGTFSRNRKKRCEEELLFIFRLEQTTAFVHHRRGFVCDTSWSWIDNCSGKKKRTTLETKTCCGHGFYFPSGTHHWHALSKTTPEVTKVTLTWSNKCRCTVSWVILFLVQGSVTGKSRTNRVTTNSGHRLPTDEEHRRRPRLKRSDSKAHDKHDTASHQNAETITSLRLSRVIQI